MGKVHLVIPDPHATYDADNSRFDLVGKLIADLRPDVVVNLGDHADMASMCGYDKGTKSFQGRSYRRDIEVALDAHERMWAPIRKLKRRLPRRYILEGNHEHRIKRALNLQPELEGAIDFKDLAFNDYYNEVIEYDGGTPGVKEIDGIYYSHYFISGVMGRPISGEHPAYSLLTKQFVSCTVGHLHVFDHSRRSRPDGTVVNGLVAGVYQEHRSHFAGGANDLWWRGVVIKNNVDGTGNYDLQQVSLEYLKKYYAER